MIFVLMKIAAAAVSESGFLNLLRTMQKNQVAII